VCVFLQVTSSNPARSSDVDYIPKVASVSNQNLLPEFATDIQKFDQAVT
jgi:hypothetical protein